MIPDLPVYAFAPNWGGLASLFLTILLPLLVGIVTRPSTSANAKALLLLVLALVKTFVEAFVAAQTAHVAFQAVPVLMNVVVNFGIAVALYYGLLKPTGVASGVAESVGPKDPKPRVRRQ